MATRKCTIPPPIYLGSIEEEGGASEYYLDLGTESPTASTPNPFENKAFVEKWAATRIAIPRVPVRHTPSSSSSFTRRKKEAIDRDCGICFEYAVVPCRTLCCGKIFCTEHLADWLHGPNAEGRCPNCENACSLEGGTLSLAPPTLLSSSQIPPSKRNVSRPALYPASPLAAVQLRHNDTVHDSPPPAMTSKFTQASCTSTEPSAASSTSSSATILSSDAATSTDEERRGQPHGFRRVVVPQVHSASSVLNLGGSTTPFSTSWGTASRFMSIVTFVVFLYKLLS